MIESISNVALETSERQDHSGLSTHWHGNATKRFRKGLESMQAKIDGDRYRVAGRKAISIRLNFLVPSALDTAVWMHSARKFKMKEITAVFRDQWISLLIG